MDCSRCGHANRATARFCAGCGQSLLATCPACGAECAPGARFCDACGANLAAPAATSAEGTRKVVTAVFADLIGSTSLHERLDAEATRVWMERYYAVLRDAIEAHHGTVVKFMGDGVMAAFGVPDVREDDARRAVQSAVAMQDAFTTLAAEHEGVGLRVAVNTGEVVTREGDDDIVGDPVNVAARLQQECADGEVLIGDATRRLVADYVTLVEAGSFALKGRTERVTAWRVTSLDAPTGVRTTRFVGRDNEVRQILDWYDAVARAEEPAMVVVLGSPGLGKSRLVAEVGAGIGASATVVAVQCAAAATATFAPLADALRALGPVDDLVPDGTAERERIVAGVGAVLAGKPAAPEETFWSVRRLFAALGESQPVVLVLDDIHWAEPLLLDLAEHLVEWSRGVGLFVLAAARPELRDVRSSLTAPGRVVNDVVTLDGLDAGAASRLAADILGAGELPAAVAGHVLTASDGNPLFLTELVRMLIEDGALRADGDRWVAAVDMATVEMPPSIHALLAARIERLPAEDRMVLERASVIGRHFSPPALAALLPHDRRADLTARLESLRRRELVESDSGWFLGEPQLRFHHVLIRDAAYRRLLKETRAELHVQFADWLAEQHGDEFEHDEMLGWHLEQAFVCRSELGAAAEYRSLGERAAARLAAAGRRALARDDVALAASLLGRAVDCLPADDAERASLALDWCEALLSAGDVDAADAAVRELGRWAGTSDRLRAWHACFTGQLAVLIDPLALHTTLESVTRAAADLEAADDAAGEAKAHFVLALALVRLGQVGACELALDRALVAARRADDRRLANAVLSGAPLAALWGPSPITRASGRCLDVVRVLRITSGSPAVEAVALRCQAVLEALRGRTDAARKMVASSRRVVEELGLTHRVLEADMFAGIVELLDGDPEAAAPPLRAAYEGLRTRGLATDAAQAAALLARAQLRRNQIDDAVALSYESEALAGDDIKAAIAWRGVRAEALASRGDNDRALALAREAVELAAATDALLDHADARLALAAALRATGRAAEAEAEIARAADLRAAKGATTTTERPQSAPTLPFGGPQASGIPASGAQRARAHQHAASEMPEASIRPDELIATRGDRLTLVRTKTPVVATADSGPREIDMLVVSETDSEERQLVDVWFDESDLDAAYAELDKRYTTGEAARYLATWNTFSTFLAAVDARDFDALRVLFTPDAIVTDHRQLGFGTVGRDDYILLFRSIVELAPHTTARCAHVPAIHERAIFTIGGLSGDHGGGDFEIPVTSVLTIADDSIVGFDLFDTDQFDEALAFFESRRPRSPAISPIPPNDATRASDRMQSAWEDRDWSALDALLDEAVVYDDRRAGLATTGDREMYLGTLRFTAAPDTRWIRTLLAAPAPHLHLDFSHWEGESFVAEMLSLVEVNADGLVTALIVFDEDNRRGAWLELSERLLSPRHQPSPVVTALVSFARAVSDHDTATLAHLSSERLVVDDHRRTGFGLTTGFDNYIPTIDALHAACESVYIEQAYRVAETDEVLLAVGRTRGQLRTGGDFEAEYLTLVRSVDGRLDLIEFFELDDIASAQARFDELTASGWTIPPNAASRATDRRRAAAEAHDWDTLRELCSESMVYDDRRFGINTIGDRDTFVASVRHVATGVTRPQRTLLSAPVDRLCLEHSKWELEEPEAEVEVYTVFEVDKQGLLTNSSHFDDRRAAFDLLVGRLDELDSDRPIDRIGREWTRAMSTRDIDAMREIFDPGVVVQDHRRAGYGQADGLDAYLDALRALWESTRENTLELVARVAESATSTLFVARLHGYLNTGGEFETMYVLLGTASGNRIVASEVFELEDLDQARARFDELNAPAPGNAASRANAAMARAYEARDFATIRRMHADEMTFQDRRQGVHVTGDADMTTETFRLAADLDTAFSRVTLETFGERVAVELVTYTGKDNAFEVETMLVCEVDDDGRFVRATVYDLADRHAAFRTALEYFVEGEGAPFPVSRELPLINEAFNGHAFDRLRTELGDDFRFVDRRRIVLLGEGDRDTLADWTRDLVAMTSEWHTEAIRIVDIDDHGAIVVTRAYGTLTDGVAFENVIVVVVGYARGAIRLYEMFDIEDLALAIARFQQLGTSTTIIPPNGAARAYERGNQAFERTVESELLASFGDRVAVVHNVWTGTELDGTAESVVVVETDENERIQATVTFEVDDQLGPFDEATARFVAGEAAPYAASLQRMIDSLRLLNVPDFDAFRALLHDDFQAVDARRTGVYPVLDPDGYLAMLRSGRELTDDICLVPVHVVRWTHSAALILMRVSGSWADGAFENLTFALTIFDGDRLRYIENFEADDVERGIARFDELTATAPGLIRANTASRAYEGNPRVGHELLASLGDHVAIVRSDQLTVIETGDDGRARAVVSFEFDDRVAAFADAYARYASGEGATDAGQLRALVHMLRALNAHDFDAFRSRLHEEFASIDHRRTGVLPTLGPGEFVESMRLLEELAPDFAFEVVNLVAQSRGGVLIAVRMRGTTTDGAPFENLMYAVAAVEGDHLRRYEAFELDDLDRATAHFEALSAASGTVVPPNAAVRARELTHAAFERQDWDTLRKLAADEFVWEERRRSASVRTGVDGWIASFEFRPDDPQRRVRCELLGTAGERVALEHHEWASPTVGVTIELLCLTAVDGQGRITATITFEVDDRSAAFAELASQFWNGEGAACASAVEPLTRALRTINHREFDRLRALLHEDFRLFDHRRTGVIPELDADGFLGSQQTLADLAAGLTTEAIRALAWNEHGTLMVLRQRGTTPDGGVFENVMIGLSLQSGGKFFRYEAFDADDISRAQRRFEELSAQLRGREP